MPNRTFYLADKDQQVWDRAKAYAYAHRLSLSTLIVKALEAFIADWGKA